MTSIRNALFLSVVVFVTASAFFALGLTAGGYFGYRFVTVADEVGSVDQAEAEYYRGIYDVCIQQVREIEMCHEIVHTVTDAGWYEKPSSGWEWPPDPEGTVARYR
jgi:hypothetical protein